MKVGIALEGIRQIGAYPPGVPWTMSGTPTKVRKPAPLRGADTVTGLRDLLGYSQTEIERQRADGVLTRHADGRAAAFL